MKLRIKPVNKKAKEIILIIYWLTFFYILFFPHHLFGTFTTGKLNDKVLAVGFSAMYIIRSMFRLVDAYRKPPESAKSST